MTRVSSGAALPYPPRWQRFHGDAGTATAVLLDAHKVFLGYLNLTPRQARESLRNWGSFRIAHNMHEGDRDVKTLAVARNLRFRSGHGTCVRDTYTTATGAHYVEFACLVAGARASSVIVGAAPPAAWPQVSPLIEQAISSFTT